MHKHYRLDVIGATLSVACALHCLAAPLLVGFVPYVFDEGAELVLALLLFGVASLAIVRGVRKHGDAKVLLPFALGLVVFMLPRGEEGSVRDVSIAVSASLGLVTAHVMNLRSLAAVAARCC